MRRLFRLRKLVPCSSVEQAPGGCLADVSEALDVERVLGRAQQRLIGAPLFEMKSHLRALALVAQGANPGRIEGSYLLAPAFPADNHPVNAAQVDLPRVFE